MKKRSSVVLLICLSLLFLTSCKSKAEIKQQVSGLVNFYDATSIMEKFKETNQKFIMLSSWRSRRDDKYYYSEDMSLQYDYEGKCFYGKYTTEEKLLSSDLGDFDKSEVYYVKLDKYGYHVQEGIVLPDEVKNFKYMFESVNFRSGSLSDFKLVKAIYNFELPEYVLEYKVTQDNKEINYYLDSINYLQYGNGSLLRFTVNDFGKMDFVFFLNKDKSVSINESVRYKNEYSDNYKMKFFEVKKNE